MSTALFDLSGKRALITGSSRGLGLAIAKGLIDAGAEVVINARNEETLKQAIDSMGERAAKASYFAVDVTDPDAVKEMFDELERTNRSIDILFNNAGMQHRSQLEDFPIEKFDQMMRLNVNAAFYVAQQAVKYMIPRGHGRVINTCSLMSFIARREIAPYVASKGAIAALTRGMSTDWAPLGINVNGIAPGYFKTELNEALVNNKEFSSWLEGRTPMKRWGEIDELVGAAIFLASSASNFMTGQVVTVDGGLTASI